MLMLARNFGLLVIMMLGSSALRHRHNMEAKDSLMKACTDSELISGTNVASHIVNVCLGKGAFGEVWSLHNSKDVLKYSYDTVDAEECIFGKIAATKDKDHFVNCSGVSSWQKGGYSLWDMADGTEMAMLEHDSAKLLGAFPSLSVLLEKIYELFHALDALQRPGTIGPAAGVRQWHEDLHSGNILVSSSGALKLIDYGKIKQCCADEFQCIGIDPSIKPCGEMHPEPDKLNFECGTKKLLKFFVFAALPLSDSAFVFRDMFGTRFEIPDVVKKVLRGLRPAYRGTCNLQCQDMLSAMVAEARVTDHDWPPPFMGQIDDALASLLVQATEITTTTTTSAGSRTNSSWWWW